MVFDNRNIMFGMLSQLNPHFSELMKVFFSAQLSYSGAHGEQNVKSNPAESTTTTQWGV